MKRQKRIGWLALCAVIVAAACSVDDFVEFGGIIGIDDGAGGGTRKSLSVDGTEEERIELKTGAAVTVPKDALDKAVVIGMERPDDKAAVTLVKSLKNYEAIVSAPYVLTPHGTKFKNPVSIEIPVNKSTDKKLVVGWLENESDKNWKRLGEPVVKNGVAKIDIDHFSVVILLEEDKADLSESPSADVPGRDGGASAADAGDSKPDVDTGAEPRDAGATGEGGGDGQPTAEQDASMQLPDPGAELDAGIGWPDASTQADAEVIAPTEPADAGTQAPIDGGDASLDAGDADDDDADTDIFDPDAGEIDPDPDAWIYTY